MSTRFHLSAVTSVLLNLLAPDTGGGSGNPAPAPEPDPAPAPEPPIVGATLEEKLASAKSIIGQLHAEANHATRLTSERDALTAENTRLQQQFDAATADATAARADLEATRGKLTAAEADLATTATALSASVGNIERLEKLCGLKGIDPNQAVASSESGDAQDQSPEDLSAAMQAISDPIERTNFYRKNKSKIDAANQKLHSKN